METEFRKVDKPKVEGKASAIVKVDLNATSIGSGTYTILNDSNGRPVLLLLPENAVVGRDPRMLIDLARAPTSAETLQKADALAGLTGPKVDALSGSTGL